MNIINLKKEDGFGLLIVPFFFVMVALFMVSVTEYTKPKQYYFEASTERSMEDVKLALAAFAHRNYRIPCPADPSQTGVNFGTEMIGCTNANSEGIVPFRTLGLTEQDVKDEWGNYLTYTVSTAYTDHITAANFDRLDDPSAYTNFPADAENQMIVSNNTQLSTYVHEVCRDGQTWQDSNISSYRAPDGNLYNINTGNAQTFSKNIFKAQFCCGGAQVGTNPDTFDSESEFFQAFFSENTGGRTHVEGDAEYTFFDTISNVEWRNAYGDMVAEIYDVQNRPLTFTQDVNHSENNGLGVRDLYDIGKTLNDEALVVDFTEPRIGASFEISDVGTNDVNKAFYSDVTFTDTHGNELGTYRVMNMTPTQANEHIMSINIDVNSVVDPNTGENILQQDFPDISLGDVRISRVILRGGDTNTLTDPNNDISWGLKSLETVPEFAMANSDLTIINEDGVRQTNARLNSAYRPPEEINTVNNQPAVDYTNYTTMEQFWEGNKTAPVVDNGHEVVAYALISHGPNKGGAYLGNGTNNRLPVISGNASEINNADGDSEVVDQRRILSADDTAFDDIIVWDTQFSLYNALGNGTCQAAQTL